MSKAAPEIEILRTGTFTATSGETMTFSAEDLIELAAAYDPARDPAPIVIGHPKTDDPAYGWAGALVIKGDRLVTSPTQMETSFAESVTQGRYKRISPSIYRRDDPANPTPGKLQLKHIGFLGAQAPAIKGLKPVAFSAEQEAAALTFDFAFSEPDPNPHQEKDMNEPKKDEAKAIELAERETTLDARETALKAREDKLTEAAKAMREAANLDFCEGLISRMALPPAHKDRTLYLLNRLGEMVEPLSFGEGDKAETPEAALKALLNAAVPIQFGEIAKPEDKLPAKDQEASAIATRALQFAERQAKAGTPISAARAVRHVMAEAGG